MPSIPPRPPLSIAPSGHGFTDRAGRPFFWLGDTQWNLWRCHALEEARFILEDRKAKGFSVVQVMLRGFANGVASGPVCGEAFPDGDPLRPNAAYFDHVDAVVRAADDLGLLLVVGADHPAMRITNPDNARAYGLWLGERYRAFGSIVWIPTYAIPNAEHLPTMRELAAGLREGGGGGHLMTSHPDPAHPVVSSSAAHGEPWLAFNCIQTFSATHLVYETTLADFHRAPHKPVVMAEGAYEGGTEYGFDVTPLWIRRQAYWSYLAGGHHSYGHNDAWRVAPGWKAALDAPGAGQMTVLRRILGGKPFGELVPDPTLLLRGAGQGNSLNAAARAASGSWAVVYLSGSGPVSIRTDWLPGRALVLVYDPRDGSCTTGEVDGASPLAVSVPDGSEDAVVVIGASA
jgi:hypothetical protein